MAEYKFEGVYLEDGLLEAVWVNEDGHKSVFYQAPEEEFAGRRNGFVGYSCIPQYSRNPEEVRLEDLHFYM